MLQTRLVDHSLNLDLILVSDDSLRKTLERDFVCSRNDDLQRYVYGIDGGTDVNPALIKVLSEMCKKLDRLESIILNEVGLEFDIKCYTKSLGHGMIIADHNIFQPDSEYYARLKMLSFLGRNVFFFSHAISENTIVIDKMHEDDTVEYDRLIAFVEREYLRLRRK